MGLKKIAKKIGGVLKPVLGAVLPLATQALNVALPGVGTALTPLTGGVASKLSSPRLKSRGAVAAAVSGMAEPLAVNSMQLRANGNGGMQMARAGGSAGAFLAATSRGGGSALIRPMARGGGDGDGDDGMSHAELVSIVERAAPVLDIIAQGGSDVEVRQAASRKKVKKVELFIALRHVPSVRVLAGEMGGKAEAPLSAAERVLIANEIERIFRRRKRGIVPKSLIRFVKQMRFMSKALGAARSLSPRRDGVGVSQTRTVQFQRK